MLWPTVSGETGSTKNYYDDANTNKNYKATWGEGNIHFPFFPDKSVADLTNFKAIEEETATETFSQGAEDLTKKIADVGGIDFTSEVT